MPRPYGAPLPAHPEPGPSRRPDPPLPVAGPAAVMGTLPVRARVESGAGAATERLDDPLTRECAAGSAFARERFATLWSDTAALSALARAKCQPLPPALAEALR